MRYATELTAGKAYIGQKHDKTVIIIINENPGVVCWQKEYSNEGQSLIETRKVLVTMVVACKQNLSNGCIKLSHFLFCNQYVLWL